jgi:TetR/AcrR family transcriptional repressor of nem operon
MTDTNQMGGGQMVGGLGASQSSGPSRRAQILNAASLRVRLGGYHGFSFRDVAADVGVRAASVHYHFATKADLGAALVDHAAEAVFDTLGPAEEPGAILRLIALYRTAVRAEAPMPSGPFEGSAGLPGAVRAACVRHRDRLVGWVGVALGTAADRAAAETVVAGLDGAYQATDGGVDPAPFDRVAACLLDAARGQPLRSTNPYPACIAPT